MRQRALPTSTRAKWQAPLGERPHWLRRGFLPVLRSKSPTVTRCAKCADTEGTRRARTPDAALRPLHLMLLCDRCNRGFHTYCQQLEDAQCQRRQCKLGGEHSQCTAQAPVPTPPAIILPDNMWKWTVGGGTWGCLLPKARRPPRRAYLGNGAQRPQGRLARAVLYGNRGLSGQKAKGRVSQ